MGQFSELFGCRYYSNTFFPPLFTLAWNQHEIFAYPTKQIISQSPRAHLIVLLGSKVTISLSLPALFIFSLSLSLSLSLCLSFFHSLFFFLFFLSWNGTNASLCAMLIFWPADKVWDWEIYACGCADAGAEGEKSDRRDQMQEHDNAWNAAPWARKLMAERRLSLLEQPLRPRYGAQMVRER